MQLDVSVVVPMYDRAPLEQLLRCLDSQTATGFEVLIAGPREHFPLSALRRRFRLPRFRFLASPVRSAIETCLEKARGKLVVFCAPDALVTDDFLATHLAAHAKRPDSPQLVLGGQSGVLASWDPSGLSEIEGDHRVVEVMLRRPGLFQKSSAGAPFRVVGEDGSSDDRMQQILAC